MKGNEEVKELRALQFKFSRKQHDRILDKMAEGKSGWDNPIVKKLLIKRLQERVNGKDLLEPYNLIDIANICMFLWNLGDNGN
jgi:hypothetical protein